MEADVRVLDAGRSAHFSSYPVHPRHHVYFVFTIPHHPRVISGLQRPCLALSLESAILIPRRNQSSTLPTLYRSHTSFQFVRRVLHGGGRKNEMGSVAYTRILGYCE